MSSLHSTSVLQLASCSQDLCTGPVLFIASSRNFCFFFSGLLARCFPIVGVIHGLGMQSILQRTSTAPRHACPDFRGTNTHKSRNAFHASSITLPWCTKCDSLCHVVSPYPVGSFNPRSVTSCVARNNTLAGTCTAQRHTCSVARVVCTYQDPCDEL